MDKHLPHNYRYEQTRVCFGIEKDKKFKYPVPRFELLSQGQQILIKGSTYPNYKVAETVQ